VAHLCCGNRWRTTASDAITTQMSARIYFVGCVVAATLCSGLAACGPRSGAAGVLDRYARLLQKRDYSSAYDLMSDSYRARVRREDYVKMMKESSREVDDTASRLQGDAKQVSVSAEFRYGLGDTLRLVQEDGAWRVVGDAFDYYDQSSPRAALRSFLRAYKLKRWDIMLKFVPSAYAAAMDQDKMKAQFTGPSQKQIDELLETVAANQGDEIVENGAAASLSYGGASEVVFVREDGLWKIKDLD
jgi:hypothetical protein